jgi:hypothetical protein
MDVTGKEFIFYLLLLAGLILSRLPYVGIWFRVVNTLIHESGHALAAILTSGKVVKIQLFSDTAGTAVTAVKNRFAGFLVSLAGYVVASLATVLFFYLLRTGNEKLLLYFLLVLALLNLIFYVRNWYGIFWIILFSALTGGLLYLNNPDLVYYYAVFLATLSFTESLLSSLTLLVIHFKNPQTSSDAKNLRDTTHLHSVFWAFLFFAFAFACCLYTVLHFFPVFW